MTNGVKTKKNTSCSSTLSNTATLPRAGDKDEAIERSKFVYEQVNGWIENADNKVSVSCGIFTGVFGVVTFLSERISGTVLNECWSCVYRASFIISLLLLGGSILAYVWAINPNLGNSGANDALKKVQKKYPIYYGDISEFNKVENYKRQIQSATNDDFLSELQDEIHYNSCICIRKMKNYKLGLWLSFYSVGFAMLGLGVRLFMYA